MIFTLGEGIMNNQQETKVISLEGSSETIREISNIKISFILYSDFRS